MLIQAIKRKKKKKKRKKTDVTFKIFKRLTRSLPVSGSIDESYQFGNSTDTSDDVNENNN